MKIRLALIVVALALAGCATGPRLPAPIPVELEQGLAP
jgi:hypothetical protein